MKIQKYKLYFFRVTLCLPFLILSCGVSPQPINYGTDECEHCRMMISDNKYGAEIVNSNGKLYKFDSIECLIEFSLTKNLIGDEKQSFLVTNFSKPGELIDAKTAFYIHNYNFRSPMGLNVSAVAFEAELKNFLTTNGGKKLGWVDVIEMVKQKAM